MLHKIQFTYMILFSVEYNLMQNVPGLQNILKEQIVHRYTNIISIITIDEIDNKVAVIVYKILSL